MDNKLGELMGKSGLTLTEVAKRTGYSISTVSRYIKDEVKIINHEYYDCIYQALSDNKDESVLEVNTDILKNQIMSNEQRGTNYTSYNKTIRKPKRGEIWYVKNTYATGNEVFGSRPAVIIGDQKVSDATGTYEVLYVTSKPKYPLPTRVSIKTHRDLSIVLCEQIHSISRERIENFMGYVSEEELRQIEKAIMLNLGIKPNQVDVSNSHDYYRLQIENRMLKETNDNLMKILLK